MMDSSCARLYGYLSCWSGTNGTTPMLETPLPAEQFRHAMEAAEVGGFVWDSRRDLISLFGHAQALLGDVPAYLSYADFLLLVHPEDRDTADRELRASLASGATCIADVRLAAPSPDVRWIRVRGRGRSELRGILVDVTEQKVAEAAKYRLAAIVASSDDAVIGKTLDGIITDWNAGATAIFGYTDSEMIGRSIALLLPPGQEDETPRILELIRHGVRIEHYETRRRRKGGEIIDVSLTVSPVYDDAGRLLGASKVARDITGPKRARAALVEREAHLQSVLETVPDAMIVIDGGGTIRSFSATAERLFGYDASEVIGHNVRMLMPLPDQQQHDSYISHYHATGERRIIGKGRTVIGLKRDGTTFPIELSIGEMRSGEQRYFTGFARDLTERQNTQQRLQVLQAEVFHMSRFTAMGEMAATLAHELNQPLTAIAGYLNGCRMLLNASTDAQAGTLRDAVERAAEQALRAGQIIRRLREFVSRGESERQAEDLARLVQEASALALVGIKQTGVRVAFNLLAEPVAVVVDRIQIQQVLLNLVRNAIEAMSDSLHRQLTIATSLSHSGLVEISVADTGPGIADEIAERLFQPFVTTKTDGMGIGLSISRSIVEAHGGKLWVDPRPGGGSIFRLTLKRLDSAGIHHGP